MARKIKTAEEKAKEKAEKIKKRREFYISADFDEINIEDIKKDERRVAYILRNYPESRNCDKLVIRYFRTLMEKVKEDDKYFEILESSRPETSIVRCRQRIQNTPFGLFPPTDEKVMKKRRLMQVDYTDFYGREREGFHIR